MTHLTPRSGGPRPDPAVDLRYDEVSFASPATGETLTAPLALHPLESEGLMVFVPGRGSKLDSFQQKYLRLGAFARRAGLAVLRTDNPEMSEEIYGPILFARAKATLDYARAHAIELTGRTNPKIYLCGISAGAGALSVLAPLYPETESLLLIAPSGRAVGWERFYQALARCGCPIHILIGDKDEDPGVFRDIGDRLLAEFGARGVRTDNIHTFIVDDCGHQFKNRRLTQILTSSIQCSHSN